jgi:hypothetical protein
MIIGRQSRSPGGVAAGTCLARGIPVRRASALGILTNDVAARATRAKEIKQLYALRSQVVHAGGGPVVWAQARSTQNLAEELFWRVLYNVDLSIEHAQFIKQLSFASYGSPWPPAAKDGGTT